MKYRKGDRIKHPAKDDWGLGEVLESSNGESIKVFFIGVGENNAFAKIHSASEGHRRRSETPLARQPENQ